MKHKRKNRIFFRLHTRGKLMATHKHHCETPRCRGIVNRKSEHSPYCTDCRRANWKASNPLRYAFGNLRRRAKQRGKDFSLTFEQYREFAIKTDYDKMRGKTSLSLSIDRINNERGYHFDNIQAITLRENTRKQFVPFFARQMENTSYEPTAEELEAVKAAMNNEN